MSALLSNGWNLVPLAVLGASLLGSMHCVSMCGPLVVSVAHKKNEIILYHLGRLIGYSLLGALAGLLGETVLTRAVEGSGVWNSWISWTSWISWIAAVGVGLSLILIGLKSWNGGGAHFFRLPSPVLNYLYRHAGRNAFLTGALSAFLPCGWLQSFLIAAVATRNTGSGALLLFFFWLGTLPALALTPFLVHRFLAPLAKKLPRASAILLITAGLLSIGLKTASTVVKKDSSASCHHVHEN